ncbi:MAG: hypothetical protein IJD77_03940 [Clostridia bacterium]|nr:hypothetical protein [Clostridia bacterium]
MMRKKKWISLALALSMLTPFAACGGSKSDNGDNGNSNDGIYVTAEDNQYDATIHSLVATDALGRSFDEALVTDSNNKVGLFYWIWHGVHTNAGIFNISELLENDPDALWGTGADVREKSPLNAMHYWAEPLYGYYSSDDPWVIKKHLELFIMSGIDYLALDLTNLLSYDDNLEILAEEIQRLQAQGWNPPTILPIFGYNIYSRNNIYPFYEKFYKNPQYDSIWFKEDGKPVLCADLADTGDLGFEDLFEYLKEYNALTDEQINEFKEHFTFRNTLWPYQHEEKYDTVQDDDMSWIDWYYPQHISGKGFVNVSVAQHPAYAFSASEHPEFRDIYYNENRGRGWDYTTQMNSYRNVLSGLNLENQWKTALDNLDKVDEVMVTGWNEWIATKLTNYHSSFDGYVQFADQFNMEFSRDLEMMADESGYGDNFYLQNMRNTRKFKNGQSVSLIAKTDSPALSSEAWEKGRTYLDVSGEVVERNHRNTDGSGMYVNTTNRNDVVSTQMVNDGSYLYIRVTTLNDIIIEEGAQNNLNILLSIKGSQAPAWEGYQFVLNRTALQTGLSKTTLEKVKVAGRYEFESVASVDSYLEGKTLCVKIPLNKLGITNAKNFTVDFKVADGISDPSNIMKYYVDGESAPVGRLNYRYNAGK